MLDHFRMFAGYNAWANARVYDAAAKLSEAEYRDDRGAFFGSMHATLNHLMLTDGMWRTRLTGEGELRGPLSRIVYDDLAALRAARGAWDAWMTGWIETLDEARLASPFGWTRLADGGRVEQPTWAMLGHIFNHQTHHRGQAHAILSSLRGPDFAPSLDLPVFQRESGLGWIAQ